MTQPFLSVIIPGFNEATRLPATLADIADYLSRAPFTAEVIVVNDGSTDATVDAFTQVAHGRAGWRLIDNATNAGKGAAVRDGMLAASGEWRLFMDADNSTSLSQLAAMLPLMSSRQRILIGSRAVAGARLEPPQGFVRRWGGKAGNLVIQALALPGMWDTQCGFKVFPSDAATKIFSSLRTTGWGFDVEALVLGRQLGIEIVEVPVRWVNNPVSRVGWRGYISTLRDVVRVRVRLGKAQDEG